MKPLKIFLTLALISLFTSPLFSEEVENKNTLNIYIEDKRLIAIENNLDIKLTQLDSKIKGTELSYKEAMFDTVLSGDIGYTDDQTKRSSSLYGTKSITNDYNIGIDKKIKATGTDVAIDLTNSRNWSDSPYASTNPYHESQGSISLTQPIAKNFFGLIDRGEIEILKYEINNTSLDSYMKIEDYMVEAETAYWNLVLAYEEVAIRKEILERATDLFDQYKKNLDMGLNEPGDVLGVEANMHTRESELLIAKNNLISAEELLKVKLNIKKDITLIPTDTLKTEDITDSFKKELKIAFDNRRDYLRDKNNIEAKKINLKMKKNSLFPEIDLKATLAQNGIDTKYNQAIQDVIEDSNPKYYVGLEFSFSLENNKAKSERIKADLEKTKAIITLQKTERKIISEVDEKFRSKNIKKQHHLNMERVLALQKGKLAQEEKRFKYGRSNSDLLIRYQEDLLNAELTSKRSLYDYKVSLVELLAAEDHYLQHIGLE